VCVCVLAGVRVCVVVIVCVCSQMCFEHSARTVMDMRMMSGVCVFVCVYWDIERIEAAAYCNGTDPSADWFTTIILL